MPSLLSFTTGQRRRNHTGSLSQSTPPGSAQFTNSSLPGYDRIEDARGISPPSSPLSKTYENSHGGHIYLTILSPLLHTISLVFLILVVIGNLHNKAVLRHTYFIKLDLSHLIPRSVPNAVLINSIARTIGLHDFYQVGLWGFCEGYEDTGITYCSPPKTLYWFNPIKILLNELLAGATIALPADITSALKLVKDVSEWMFGLFIISAPLQFLCILFSPFSTIRWRRDQKRKRWYLFRSLPLTLLTFLAAFTTIVACVIATVMFAIFRNVFTSGVAAVDLNIGAKLGTQMLTFMWVAAGAALLSFLIQFLMCCGACCKCCGAGRKRDKHADRGEAEHGSNLEENNGAKKRGMEEQRSADMRGR